MIGESILAHLATLAVSTGFDSSLEWHQHYASWGEAKGLSASIAAFVMGSARFLESLGTAQNFAQTMMSVLIISFAATSLDTATRIQRYMITEVGELSGIRAFMSPWISAAMAVLSALFLMLIQKGGKGGLSLWPLFGATNQMLAALSFLVISIYLVKNKKGARYYFLPGIFVYCITALALIFNIYSFWQQKNFLLFSLSFLLLLVQIIIGFEAKKTSRKNP